MAAFTSGLLQSNPPIHGLDASIVISPRRLHLTLGVMSLDQPAPATSSSVDTQHVPKLTPPTLDDAEAVLHNIRPHVLEMLGGHALRVGLERMDIMKPERGDPEKAHVLFVGPDLNSEDGRRLRTVCDYVQKAFKDGGLVIDERRELKLHCTLLNTTYRKRKPRGARTPFSYAAVVSSEAIRSISPSALRTSSLSAQPDTLITATATPTQGKASQKIAPIAVNLGTWDVEEIQICKMGSWGPEGEYVVVARCPLA